VVVDLRSQESNGAQQALVMGLAREEQRGLAASLNDVTMQLPRTGCTIAFFGLMSLLTR